jgi:hypothetical protein
MKRIMKKAQTAVARQTVSGSRFSRGVFALVAIAAFMFATAGANACPNLSGSGSNSPIKLPILAQAGNIQSDSVYSDSIVGLWQVVYTPVVSSTPITVSFKEWHSDGTEFENIWLAPVGGDICFGAWKTIAPRTVHTHHIGWIFATPGATATNYFIQDETDTVSRDGKTYTGTYKMQVYSLAGAKEGPETDGTIAATRITAD